MTDATTFCRSFSDPHRSAAAADRLSPAARRRRVAAGASARKLADWLGGVFGGFWVWSSGRLITDAAPNPVKLMMALDAARAEQPKIFQHARKRRRRFPLAAIAGRDRRLRRARSGRAGRRHDPRGAGADGLHDPQHARAARISPAHVGSQRRTRALGLGRVAPALRAGLASVSRNAGKAHRNRRLVGRGQDLADAGRDHQDGRLARRAPRAPARTGPARARRARSSKPRPAITGSCACWRVRASTITSPTRSIW